MIRYQNQSISKLTFYLLKTRHLPDNIHVLKRKYIEHPNYQLDLRMVGTSHALSITTRCSTLTELVVCSPIDETQVSAFQVKRLCESVGSSACLADLRYSIEWEIQRFTPNTFGQQAHRLHQRKTRGFSYEFPTKPAGMENAPLTLIEYVCRPKHVQIQTHHSYPNEFGLVVTRTQVELR